MFIESFVEENLQRDCFFLTLEHWYFGLRLTFAVTSTAKSASSTGWTPEIYDLLAVVNCPSTYRAPISPTDIDNVVITLGPRFGKLGVMTSLFREVERQEDWMHERRVASKQKNAQMTMQQLKDEQEAQLSRRAEAAKMVNFMMEDEDAEKDDGEMVKN